MNWSMLGSEGSATWGSSSAVLWQGSFHFWPWQFDDRRRHIALNTLNKWNLSYISHAQRLQNETTMIILGSSLPRRNWKGYEKRAQDYRKAMKTLLLWTSSICQRIFIVSWGFSLLGHVCFYLLRRQRQKASGAVATSSHRMIWYAFSILSLFCSR